MRYTIIILLFLSSFYSSSQDQNGIYNNQPIVDVIQDLESKFSVRFSYNTSLLKGKTISLSDYGTLESILESIQIQTALEFQFLDFENIIIKQKGISETTNNLIPLNEILIVTEYLTSGFGQNKKDGSILLKPNKLGVLPGLIEPDVMQSLQLLPGISSPTESASNLHIRGGTPDQNLILWDGIKMYHQGHLFGMISAFNPYIVESVNVFRSGTSAKYGERISGVIDIHSPSNIPTKTTIGIGANALHADVFMKTALIDNKLGVIVSARRSLTDWFETETFDKISNKIFQNTEIEEINSTSAEEELTILEDQFYFTDFNAKVIFKPNENNKISFSSLLVDNTLNYSSIDLEQEGSTDNLKLENIGASIHWKNTYFTKWNLDVDLHYSKYNSQYSFEELSSNIEQNRFSKTNIIEDFGALFQTEYKANENHAFTFGYDLSLFDVSYDLQFVEDNLINENESGKLITHNLFIEHNYKNNKWHLRTGMRGSYFSELSKFSLEPRFFTNYSINDIWKLKVSAEIKNQAISQLTTFEFNDLGLDNTVWVLADEDEIPVLNNKQFTAGVLFSKNGWKLDVEGYYKYTKGLSSLSKGFTNSSEDYASGSSETFGIDVLIKKQINHYRSWLSYSLSKTDFTFKSLQNNRFAGNFDQRHILTFSNTYKYKQFQFALGWSFASGIPYTTPESLDEDSIANDELVFTSQNNKRLPSYHKLDASVVYHFYLNKNKTIKAKLGASVLNIYNNKNQINKAFEIDENENNNPVIIEQNIIGLGMTPNMVFRVVF